MSPDYLNPFIELLETDRLEVGEQAAARALVKAYELGKRIPEIEPLLMERPITIYYYAKDIIKGPWPEAETAILNNMFWAYCYVGDILQTRWPVFENLITEKGSVEFAHRYAHRVIGGAWPEGEYLIKKCPNRWRSYQYFLKRVRNGDLDSEPAL